MKKALIIVVICLLAGYLIFAILYFDNRSDEGVCTSLEIVTKDDDGESFIEPEDVEKIIDEAGLNPSGKPFANVNTYKLEEAITSNKLVKKANVFKTNNGSIKIEITTRTPILRVIADNGENYYIDIEGDRMPLSKKVAAYLPVATGTIKEDFAKADLYKFALFLHKNKFWNAQIEQIVVAPNNDLELIPRVGNQRIILGPVQGYETKLDKLMTFYEKGMNEIGWNKYSVINLKYDKQVVCTKR